MIDYMAFLGASALILLLLIVLAVSEPPRSEKPAREPLRRSFPDTSWSMDRDGEDQTMNLF